MAKLFKNKRGLSQVVTTLIILVVSVLLAGVVTYYATNITMTRTQQETLVIQYAHIWVNSTGTGEAAFYLKNVGGKDVLIDKVAVRGVEAAWSTVYYNSSTTSSDLSWIAHENLTDTLTVAPNDLPVESGGTRIIYIKDPDNISLTDVGTTVSITVYTVEGQWIKEVNVQYAGS